MELSKVANVAATAAIANDPASHASRPLIRNNTLVAISVSPAAAIHTARI